MKQADVLYSLIKGMNKNEKGYFKRHALTHGKTDSNYLKLFNAIGRQENYDEQAVKKQFRGEAFIKHFSVTKHHLYHLILKSMEFYHQNNSEDAKVRSLLSRAQYLYNMSMYKECAKILNKAQSITDRYEMQGAGLEIMALRKKILSAEGNWKMRQTINEEESRLIAVIQNQQELQQLKDKLFYQYIQYGASQKQTKLFQRYLKLPILKDEKNAKTFLAKHLFWESRFCCYLALADNGQIFHCSKKILELYIAHPNLLKYHFINYLIVLNNFLYASEAIHNTRELKYGVDLLVKAKEHARTENAKTRYFFYQDNVVHYYNTIGDFHSAIKYAEENMIPHWEFYKNKVTPLLQGEFVTYIATSYFGKKDYRSSLKWLNKIYQEIKIEHYPDIILFCYMFYIIVHLELKNYDLIPSLLQAAKRFSKKWEKVNPFHKILFKHFQKIAQGETSGAQLKNIYVNLKREMENLKLDSFESEFQKRFDYLSWVESKISGSTFAEIIREKSLVLHRS